MEGRRKDIFLHPFEYLHNDISKTLCIPDVFLELLHFDDPTDVGNLISGSSAFSKSSLNIWKFTIHVLLKPGLENFEHCFTTM